MAAQDERDRDGSMRLIDADHLLATLNSVAEKNENDTNAKIIETISIMVTVEAVLAPIRIVGCGKCKYNYGLGNEAEYDPDDIVCTYWDSDGLTEDDFCSMGEMHE